jgi:putative restriction endonuclease
MEEFAEFDAPLFKKLAHNDTGAAAGHQGGVVIPKDLDQYFPDLSGRASAANPTVDEYIRAALFVGDTPRGIVSTRYQYQTWGGARSPERRITGNLGALRNEAAEDDYLIIERGATDSRFYRMRLLKAGTPAYNAFEARVGSKRWGPADTANLPVTEAAVDAAENEQLAHESHPLQLFDNAAALAESRIRRIARSRAFQKRVCSLYDSRCAVCGGGLVSPNGAIEVEAAHIVPRSLKGADDARNGICLCRSHHWAFDRGLFGINHHAKIEVPARVAALTENTVLAGFALKRLRSPNVSSLAPAVEALSWHLANVVSLHR